MSRRVIPFLQGEIYHVYNKSIESKVILGTDDLKSKFLDLSLFYRSINHTVSYSYYRKLPLDQQRALDEIISMKKYFRIEVFAYSLMPTHFHFLLRQRSYNGISDFISDIVNAFTKFYNLKYARLGPLFLPSFKATPITSEIILKHVSRYIHLNPYSSGIVTTPNSLLTYPWTSLPDYLTPGVETRRRLTSTSFILALFGNDRIRYKNFVLENAEYQKQLEGVEI